MTRLILIHSLTIDNKHYNQHTPRNVRYISLYINMIGDTEYPRLQSLGLIEGVSRGKNRSFHRRIRGCEASASLKGGIVDSGDRIRSGIRGCEASAQF